MCSWVNSTLKENETMARAIDVLNSEALRIVLVVDGNKRLLGTITDGDIRRALSRSCSMSTTLHEIMNHKPSVALVSDERSKILNLMKARDLLHIPLLDQNECLVGLETLQNLTEKPSYENVVFLMAGGFGKRLHPLTLDVPKPLLKVGNKPILETILEQFIESGFSNFCISTHYKAEMVREYFGSGEKWGVNIAYVYEEEPRGTAGALGLFPKSCSDLPVIVMNGDLLTKLNHKSLLNFHSEQGGIATMCVREYDFQVPYGVIATDGKKITDIIEKPVHTFFVNAGIYVLNMELVRRVNGIEYLDMPELLSQCIVQNEVVNMFPVHEYWLDIGNMPDYRKANSESGLFGDLS
ncbi:nucleotidyltransferase family protein [Desulforhopalus sp. 52FAK]